MRCLSLSRRTISVALPFTHPPSFPPPLSLPLFRSVSSRQGVDMLGQHSLALSLSSHSSHLSLLLSSTLAALSGCTLAGRPGGGGRGGGGGEKGGGGWQWGDAEREICLALSPSLLRGRHWAPETEACGSFTGRGCFLIHCLAMDVRRGQWREGRGRCNRKAVDLKGRLMSYVLRLCMCACVYMCVCVLNRLFPVCENVCV